MKVRADISRTIAFTKGYKYQLRKPCWTHTRIRPSEPVVSDFMSLTKSGLLAIEPGYAWDGPSGPAIDTKNFMRGSLIHDALYQLMREGKLDQSWRMAADQEMRRICLEDGMSRIRAFWAYRAVRRAAGPFAKPSRKRKVLIAPVVLALLFMAGCASSMEISEDGNKATYRAGFGREGSMSIIKPDGTEVKATSKSGFKPPEIAIFKAALPGG